MKTLVRGLKLCCLGVLLCSAQAEALLLTYSIQDAGTFSGYSVANQGQGYAGSGYVGMYQGQFAHLFGLESVDGSRTALEVDISALSGTQIDSAILSFDILRNEGTAQWVTATSYTADGLLTHEWDPHDNLGSASGYITALSPSNQIDVTALLALSVTSNSSWFGLNLRGSTAYQWTYTDRPVVDPDAAHVRLTVNFTLLPEPSFLDLPSAL